MKHPATVLLSGGGVRSLVALAQARAAQAGESMVLLHVRDGLEACEARRRHVMAQAEHFQIGRVLTLDSPWLASRPWVRSGSAQGPTTSLRHDGRAGSGAHLLRPAHLAMTALTVAAELKAARVIWPMQACDGVAAATRLTEQVQLLMQTARLEAPHAPLLTMPLLQYTDARVVGLGGQLGVPWALAWSCRRSEQRPCGRCPSCQRRAAAFRDAAVHDAAARGEPVAATL